MSVTASVNRAGVHEPLKRNRGRTDENETSRPEGRLVYETDVVSDRTNVLRLIALRATGDLEFDGLTLFE